MNFDEVFRPVGVCVKAKCRPDRVLDLNYCNRFHVSGEGCEAVNQDITKEWPQCCEKIKCKDGVREVTIEI